jgi:8-oxo-dGTP diphosphatase
MKADVEIYEEEPQGFTPQVQVSGCYLEVDGRLLLLQYAAGKFDAGKWGVPAGRLESSETPMQAAVRELAEETGIRIDASHQVRRLGSLYIRKPSVEYIYHLFKVHIDSILAIQLSNEHQNYQWASFEELARLPLTTAAGEAAHYYSKMKGKI